MTSHPHEHALVATDFSTGASRALSRAAWLPLAKAGRLTLAHVLPGGAPKAALRAAEALAEGKLREIASGLRRAAAAAGREDLRVEWELARGRPHDELERLARTRHADLVVAGRHGERPVRDLFLGSTVERLVRTSKLPVLVVTAAAARRYRRPLVAVDLEKGSAQVVRAALQALGPEVAAVELVHAYQVPFESFMAPALDAQGVTTLRKQFHQGALTQVEQLAREAGVPGVAFRKVLVRGDARSVVLHEAGRSRADLIAIGTHGRTALAQALLGSVASFIVATAPCDVLLVRARR